MNPALLILGLAVASVAITMRIEPIFPQVSRDFGMSLNATATLASGFGLAYALVQPAMGVVADRYGKPRVMLWGLVVIGVMTLACAFAPTFEFLFVCRLLVGAAAGGITPASLSLAADLSTQEERQIAISRVVLGATVGSVSGAVFSGLLSDLIGWRGMFGASAIVVVISLLTFIKARRRFGASVRSDFGSLSTTFSSYRKILTHKTAIVCFAGVFVEGATIYGVLPYVAAFLQEQGETRLSIAGLVIGALSFGIFLYTWVIGAILAVFKVSQLMIIGAVIVASQMLLLIYGPPWQIQVVSFAVMGFGYFLIHGALQAYVTEVSTVHRGKVLALHSFFLFWGQAIGTIAYGFTILHFGKATALSAAALMMVILGCVCAAILVHRPQVD